MLRFIVNKMIQKMIKQLEFPQQVDGESISKILSCFQKGIQDGIYQINTDELIQNQENTPWERRIFYREGYAFGSACIQALFFRKNPDLKNKCPNFRIMHFTGYGFFKGIANLYKIPNISFDPKYWGDTEDFKQLGPFLIGGESFAKTLYFDWDKQFIQQWEDSKISFPFYKEVAWHGCGTLSLV